MAEFEITSLDGFGDAIQIGEYLALTQSREQPGE